MVTYYIALYYIILYYTILYCIILYCIMIFHTVLYYTIRSIILYYTQVGPGDRPAPPGGRPAPRCRGVWGAATPPSGGSGGQRPPGNILVFRIFRMIFAKPGCFILNLLVGATACNTSGQNTTHGYQMVCPQW